MMGVIKKGVKKDILIGFGISLIIILTIQLNSYSISIKQEQEMQRIEAEQLRTEELQLAHILQLKIDSSKRYCEIAYLENEKHRYNTSLALVDSALYLYPENKEAIRLKGETLYLAKKYNDAITHYKNRNPDRLRDNDSEKSLCFIMLAQSYHKLGSTEEAVNYAYQASKLDSKEAAKLYDQLNPERNVLVGYRTLCCDGTTSRSTGSGACSHHGGVCKWNDPIYRNQRKYKP